MDQTEETEVQNFYNLRREGRFSEAWSHLCSSAKGGNARAMWELSNLYHNGSSMCQQHKVKGTKWLLKAANKGYARAFGDLAVCFEKGVGVPCDLAMARVWEAEALLSGDDYAKCLLLLWSVEEVRQTACATLL